MDSNSRAALFQLKKGYDDLAVTGNFSTVFIMDQIDLTCLISFCRVNFCHNAIRSKLHAFNGIRHDIFCDRVKLMEFSFSLIRSASEHP